MQLKNKLTITTSLENFVILGRFGHFHVLPQKNATSLEKCYPLYEQTMPISFEKLKLSLFPYFKFLK